MLSTRFAKFLFVFALLSAMVLLPGGSFADPRQWGEDGVFIRQGHHIEWQRAGFRRDDGYNLIVWSDTRTGDRDVYGQLLSPSGTQVWESTGKPLAQFREFRQEDPEPVAVTGGWIVAWAEFREDTSGDIWAQKFNDNGDPQWPANNYTGVRVDAHPAVFMETTIRAVHDGNGGAIIAWQDDRRDQADLIAQHVDANGVTWAEPLMITDVDNGQDGITADNDGSGNMLLAWKDGRNDPVAPDIYAAKVTPDRQLPWGNVAVCLAAGEQNAPKLCPDGANGCYIAWVDNRNGQEDLYAQRLNSSGQAQWASNGLGVCTTTYNQNGVRVALSTNSGTPDGLLLVWDDYRVNNVISEVYSQKLSSAGAELWQSQGFRVCGNASPDTLNRGDIRTGGRLASDLSGGLVCAWEDMRGGQLSANSDVYAGRVLANGTNACGECGVEVMAAAGAQFWPLVRVDGGTGFFVVWSDKRTGSQSLRYQNLSLSDCSQNLDPNGVEIVYGLDGNATRPRSVPMAPGKVGVVWCDNRFGPGGQALYYQVIDSTGHVDTVQNGVPIAPNNTDGSLYSQDLQEVCPDGDYGFFVSWIDNRAGTKRVRLSHVNSQNEVVYGDSGYVVWEAVRDQIATYVTPDGQGGCYVAWSGYAPNFWLDVYVMRMSADLQRMWDHPARLSNTQPDDVLRGIVTNPDGCCIAVWHSGPFEDVNITAARVCASGDTSWIMDVCDNPTNQDNAAIVADGEGGAYIAWADSRNFDTAGLDMYAQHVTSSGSVSWADNGLQVVTAPENQSLPSLAIDGDRNLYVVWQDFRTGDNTDIYAQKVTPAGALLWPQTGKTLCIAIGQQQEQALQAEWANGLYTVWTDGRGYHSDIYATHVNQSGQLTDPYWMPDSGGVVMDFFHIQDQPTASDDGHGGLISAWQDYRASGKEPLINIWANWVNDYTVSVHEIPDAALPKQHELSQNYPNPFNPTTQIRFSVPQREQVEILVYNMLGQRTATLLNEVMNAGAYVIDFDANSLPSGTYFYRMHTPTFQTVRKMVLLR